MHGYRFASAAAEMPTEHFMDLIKLTTGYQFICTPGRCYQCRWQEQPAFLLGAGLAVTFARPSNFLTKNGFETCGNVAIPEQNLAITALAWSGSDKRLGASNTSKKKNRQKCMLREAVHKKVVCKFRVSCNCRWTRFFHLDRFCCK